MAGTFPTLSSGTTAMYPVNRGLTCTTTVVVFVNDQEQRWRKVAALESFTLQFTNINATDRNAITTFFDTQKGQFDKSWSYSLGSVLTDANCTFDQDNLEFQESPHNPTFWSCTLKLKQVRKS